MKIIFFFAFYVNHIWCSKWAGWDNEFLEIYEKQEKELIEKRDLVKNLEYEIFLKDSSNKHYESKIAERNKEIEQMKNKLSSKTEIFDKLDAELKKKNIEIENVKNETQKYYSLFFRIFHLK